MKRKLIVFGLALLGTATIGITQLQSKALDDDRDCDRFAVIRCGTKTQAELRAEYDTNNGSPKNTTTAVQSDIQRIFRSMGASRTNMTGMVDGVVYRDGTVKVGGKTVATGAVMAARGLGGTQIAGTNAQRVSVSAMSDAQTALVKLDANGNFMFAVMKPCGNPVTATPVPPKPKPEAACKNLIAKKISDTRRRYQAVATLKNGAKVNSYTFVATKNGKQVDTQTGKDARYTFTADGPGTYKVKVTLHTSEGPRTGSQCTHTFEVKQPPKPDQPGVSIEKFVGTDQKYMRVGVNVEYDYRILVKNTGDIDLTNVRVTDTPDQGVTLISVSPERGDITNNTWVYTIPKLKVGETRTFTLTAKVPEYLAGRLVNTVCVDSPQVPGNPDDCDSAEVDVPPAPGKIQVCELATYNIITINEADFDSSKHSKDVTECKAPEELPQTGPVEVVMQVIGAMSLVGASAYYIASRHNI